MSAGQAGYASRNIRAEWSRQGSHWAVRVDGAPALNEFFSFVSWLAVETEGWSVRRLLLDLRGVPSLRDPQELCVADSAVGMALRHVGRIAAVVPGQAAADAGACGCGDPHHGATRCLFTRERDALDWLLAS